MVVYLYSEILQTSEEEWTTATHDNTEECHKDI